MFLLRARFDLFDFLSTNDTENVMMAGLLLCPPLGTKRSLNQRGKEGTTVGNHSTGERRIIRLVERKFGIDEGGNFRKEESENRLWPQNRQYLACSREMPLVLLGYMKKTGIFSTIKG